MNGTEKSDTCVVATKQANKTGRPAAEMMERRQVTEENTEQPPESRTQSREIEGSGLARVRQIAKSHPQEKLTALLHHVTKTALWQAYDSLKRQAAPGVDGISWESYGENLLERLADLHARLQNNRYRAQPSRRKYIAKAERRQRPLGIAALEEKIIQRAVVRSAQRHLRTGIHGLLLRIPAGPHPAPILPESDRLLGAKLPA